MNPLVKAIDEALAFVRAHTGHPDHPDQMTRADMDHFKELAERVWRLTPDNWLLRLPRAPELRPELELQDPPLPPVQFAGKLNLPYDWEPAAMKGELPLSYPLFGTEEPPAVPEGVFLVYDSPRWLSDMEALRKLALQSETLTPGPEAGSKQPPSLTQEDAAILKVLLQANGVTMTVGNIESKVCFTDKTIRRRLKKLRTLELVCEPEKNKGYTTTTKGADAAKKLPTDAGAKLIRSERAGR